MVRVVRPACLREVLLRQTEDFSEEPGLLRDIGWVSFEGMGFVHGHGVSPMGIG
jgi:hypothetical protein